MMERAYAAETGRDLRKIKLEYGLGHLNGMLGAEALLLDVDYFSLDYVRTKAKKAPMRQTISLADQFPMAFNRLLGTGTTYFETTLEHFDRRHPGFYLQKVKQVEVVFVGLGGSEGAHGTLRNIGVSQFRTRTGEIVDQVYPADVMPLSDYDVRRDAIVFQLDAKELRLFENNGVATMWQLDLPRSTNTFDLRQILDIQLVVYYDGFFDPGLEATIRAALPPGGSASRALSLQLYAPDELFFLRNQGSARMEITPDLFPANHVDHRLKSYVVQARGAGVDGLKVRVDLEGLGAGHEFTLGPDGTADGAAFPAPIGQSLFDTWTITIDPEANGGFDLDGLQDVAVFVEYDFAYRS
jgi:Tc toxin complex TcA C-terminal TcB-binding domain